MKQKNKRFVVLLSVLLIITMILPSCGFFGSFFTLTETPYYQMEYERPSADALQTKSKEIEEELAKDDPSFAKVADAVNAFFTDLMTYYTMDSIANIQFSVNTQSEKWREECAYLSEQTIYVQRAREVVLVACANSSICEKLEKSLFGDSLEDYVNYKRYNDDTYFEMALEEAKLVEEYRTKSSDAQVKLYEYLEMASDQNTYNTLLSEFFHEQAPILGGIYHELVMLRKNMAKQAGVENYLEIAGEGLGREFALSDMQNYLTSLKEKLWRAKDPDLTNVEAANRLSDEYEIYEILKSVCGAMDAGYIGEFEEGFFGSYYDFMRRNGLSDFSYSPRKENTSFTTYLYDYNEPFIMMNPSGTLSDATTAMHEFGHFVDMGYTGNSASSIDLAEIFSTGFEQLALYYLDDAGLDLTEEEIDALGAYELDMIISTIRSQGVYAEFEMAIYDPNSTVDTSDVQKMGVLFSSICNDWGYMEGMSGSYIRQNYWIIVPHIFQYPSYVFSYIISMDIVIQMSALEAQTPMAGLNVYHAMLDRDPLADFITVVTEAGLVSPFEEGHALDLMDDYNLILTKIKERKKTPAESSAA